MSENKATKTCGECVFYNPKMTRNGCGMCTLTTGRFKGLFVNPAMKACMWECTEKEKPITNGDKIRQMSDEELAVFLNNVDYMMREAYKDEERTLFSSAYELWLTYLKQEAKDE